MGVAPAPSSPVQDPYRHSFGRQDSDRTGPDRGTGCASPATADHLATDAAAREQAGKAPVDEVSRLREAGLLALLVPARFGGGGADWRTAYAVVREVAAADGAIGQLLGSHYFLSWSARFFTDPARAARIERRSAAEQWYWGGGFAHQEPPLH
ncbi:acyl-CoA dehydrogenase family protein [Streptomyces hirsutus]